MAKPFYFPELRNSPRSWSHASAVPPRNRINTIQNWTWWPRDCTMWRSRTRPLTFRTASLFTTEPRREIWLKTRCTTRSPWTSSRCGKVSLRRDTSRGKPCTWTSTISVLSWRKSWTIIRINSWIRLAGNRWGSFRYLPRMQAGRPTFLSSRTWFRRTKTCMHSVGSCPHSARSNSSTSNLIGCRLRNVRSFTISRRILLACWRNQCATWRRMTTIPSTILTLRKIRLCIIMNNELERIFLVIRWE